MLKSQGVGGPAPSLLHLFDWQVMHFADLQWATESGGTMTFGAARAKKAVAALKRSFTLPLSRWLFALGIPTVGENTSKEVSRLCDYASVLQLACTPGGIIGRIAAGEDKAAGDLAQYAISSHLGPVSCSALVDFIKSDTGREAITFMARHNIKSDNFDRTPTASDSKPLFGKTFCISGTLSVGRDEMKALIESKGGKCQGDVSAKTNYLVAGEACGGKLAKAGKLGVVVLNEAELRAML